MKSLPKDLLLFTLSKPTALLAKFVKYSSRTCEYISIRENYTAHISKFTKTHFEKDLFDTLQ